MNNAYLTFQQSQSWSYGHVRSLRCIVGASRGPRRERAGQHPGAALCRPRSARPLSRLRPQAPAACNVHLHAHEAATTRFKSREITGPGPATDTGPCKGDQTALWDLINRREYSLSSVKASHRARRGQPYAVALLSFDVFGLRCDFAWTASAPEIAQEVIEDVFFGDLVPVGDDVLGQRAIPGSSGHSTTEAVGAPAEG